MKTEQEQFEQDFAQFIADNWSSDDYINRQPEDEYPLNQFDIM